MEQPGQDLILKTAKEQFNLEYLYPYQRLVISNILRAGDIDGFRAQPETDPATGEAEFPDTNPRQIIILPTGSGKSLCFMLPAVLLRGPTLIIFPLLSLIADQARRFTDAGIPSAVLRGGQPRGEREAAWGEIEEGRCRVLLTNPETALQEKTFRRIQKAGFNHLVIDEAHTIAEWGKTFRPVYLEIGRLAEGTGIPIISAFTATASTPVTEQIKAVLFPDSSPNVITANPDRTNIFYRVIPSISKEFDLYRLLRRKGNQSPDGSGMQRPALVFCRSKKTAEQTARFLRRRLGEENIFFYHAGLTREEKKDIENWFYHSRNGILCATTAYGLGYVSNMLYEFF